jgi:hypothetical protein
MKGIINQKHKKIKRNIISKQLFYFVEFFKSDLGFFILVIIFSTSISFFLGKISIIYEFEKSKKEEAVFLKKKENEKIEFVASKKGSVYHFPWCSGGIKLSDKNKVFFKSHQEAQEKGYRPAKNCEGL